MQRALVEEGLTRVIGADGAPDRRLDGLDDDALLAIHRSLVTLRTYDERSVVYHRQGRIGTYAIFRVTRDPGRRGARARASRLDLPELPRAPAIGLLRGLPAQTVPAVVARPSVRMVEPAGR
jgi:pyruvate dehydrogenase E1 component alpha subunit